MDNLYGNINDNGELLADLTFTGELQGEINTLDTLSGVLNKDGELLGNLSFPIRIGGYIVYNAYVNTDGYLMFVLYDNSEINAGYVKGDTGEKGDSLGDLTAMQEQIETLEATSNYTHEQMASSALWIVNHTLNRYPAVTIVDTANTTVMGEVVYINLNRVEISFSAQFSGKAYLT